MKLALYDIQETYFTFNGSSRKHLFLKEQDQECKGCEFKCIYQLLATIGSQ